MTHSKKETFYLILKKFVLFGAFFLFLDGIFHLLGIRLYGLESVTSSDTLFVIRFFMNLWGSASVIFGILLYLLVRCGCLSTPNIVKFLALSSALHGMLLWQFSFFDWNTPTLPSAMHLWHPFYAQQLQLEGSCCLAFGLYVLYGLYKKFV